MDRNKREPNEKNACQKRCETIMIGALSEFEISFGSLWGHGIPDDQKTREEKEWLEMWLETRERILDLGNNQIKKYIYEIRIIGKQ